MLLDDKVDPTYDMGIWVNSVFFGSALKGMFDAVWKTTKAKVLA